MAERVGDGFVECRLEFLRLRHGVGCEETVLLPELAADGGKRVGEGGMRLAIPGSGRDRLAGFGVKAGAQQRHQRKQSEQARGRAGDGPVRPLALGLDPEVVADLAEGDFDPGLRRGRLCQRRTYQVRICNGSRAGSVHKRACGSNRPRGSRNRTQRIDTMGSPA
jgi:hypothetical protein